MSLLAVALLGLAFKAPLPGIVTPKKPIEAVSIIVSKGSLDMAYPALILANGARTRRIRPSTPALVPRLAAASNASMNSGRQSG